MKRLHFGTSVLLLALIITIPVMAQISPHFDLDWHLFSGGGGLRSSTHYQIDDVLGQWADGRTNSIRYQIDPGFWYAGREIEPEYLYLPVVVRTQR